MTLIDRVAPPDTTVAPSTDPSTARTTVREVTAPPAQVARRVRQRHPDDTLSLAGAAVSAVALDWLLYERLLPFTGFVGFWLCWYGLFVAIAVLLTLLRAGNREEIVDRVAAILFTTAGAAVLLAIVLVVSYTAYRGWTAIRPSFFTQTMSTTGPLSPLHDGGVEHAIVGSLEQISLALIVCVPLGIGAALYLNEVRGPLARFVRTLVDAMSAIPSILAGLFILATVVLTLGVDKSGFAASLAIAVEMLPVITRASELVFRLVPGGLREASTALGSSQWRTVRKVVLPTARAGLATAIVLGIARGIGETAPVLLVAGFTSDMNANPFSGAQVSLPLYVLTYVKYPQDTMITRAYGAGLALLIVVLSLFVIARLIGGNGPGTVSRRARRRLARADAARRTP